MAVGLLSETASASTSQTPTARAGQAKAPEPSKAPRSEAEALAEAKRTGESVEIASLRGERSEVFATPEGDLEAREYLRPVWARGDGGWNAVDTDLAKAADGRVEPKSTTVGLAFSGGGASPLVRMTKAGRELALSWPGTLPVPELDGETATYRNVLPEVDLRMGAQEDGFTQLLVVKSAEAAANPKLKELRLQLRADGMNVRETAGGGLEAIDDGAKGAVFEAPRPMMWDSSRGEAASGTASRTRSAQNSLSSAGISGDEPGAGESGKLAPVGVDLPVAGDELVLTPDPDVLAGEGTRYPVFIDPQWHSPRATTWTMASKYWASSPQWEFNGESNAGLGYCGWDYCAPHDTKRLFYSFPTSKFAGKSILSAEFVVRNVHSATCSKREVQLWGTKSISSSTTWNSQDSSDFWLRRLATESFAYGFTGCASKDAEFNIKPVMQDAANGKWGSMTFGMRASSETDRYGWKRFSDKAFLRVKYNRPPSQIKMSQLTMEYGGTCKKWDAAARVRTLGKIYASRVTDPDGDNVAVQFQAKWDSGDGKGMIARWKPALTSSKKSGSGFSIGLPSSLPQSKQVNWYARTYDGAQYSPWSNAGSAEGCYFHYDSKVPKAPTISSSEYPASDPENPDDPWLDGVGQYGSFQFKASDSDVTKYWYGINGDPTSKRTLATSAGAAKTANILPAEPGVSFVTAQAFDAAGNGSEIRTYQFRVKAGQPDRAAWKLDEPAGATQAEGSSGARPAPLHGKATLGATGRKGTGLQLDGTSGYAATDIPTVDTATSFSVSTWVKLDRLPEGAAVIAAQPGNHSPGFELYYSKGYDRWVFNQYKSDTADAGIVRAMAGAPGGVSADKWTHLVGVYSAGDDELRLYVDGKLVGKALHSTAWNARRGLQIGAANLNGAVTNFFPGTVDELRIFDKPVSDTEVGRLFRQEPIGNGRTARAVFELDEQPGAAEVTGRADTQPLTLAGNAKLGAVGMAGNALRLDGNGDYAQTAAPHLGTDRSFTASTWAKLDKKPGQAAVVASQAGQERPGFELYYSDALDRWVFGQYATDSADAKVVRAMQPESATARSGEWVHLVGVHDTLADTLTLYVNGVQAGTTELGGGFYAMGPVLLGATSHSGQIKNHFPGAIDDLRLFDRPVSADEVRELFRQRPLIKSRWKFDQTEGGKTPDDSAEGNAMALAGGAKVSQGFIEGGLELDGVGGHAATPRVPVDTSTSFTVTAWAQGAAAPKAGVAVVSAEGNTSSAFNVHFVPDAQGVGRWELVIPDADSANAVVERVPNTEAYAVTDWSHLAVVYDGFEKQARLYVNGNLQEVACPDADGDGSADEPGCEELISWSEDTLSFRATKSLQVGRAKNAGAWGEFFPGVIDDVWTFQGALTDAQVGKVAGTFVDVPTEVPGNN